MKCKVCLIRFENTITQLQGTVDMLINIDKHEAQAIICLCRAECTNQQDGQKPLCPAINVLSVYTKVYAALSRVNRQDELTLK